MRLMIVDDNKQIREGIRYGIEWEQYGIEEVRDFPDGDKALAAFHTFLPHIIIADIKMPNMDGLLLLEAVKKYKRKVKYILLSAYSDFHYVQKAVKLSAADYILKPVNPQKLIAIVEKYRDELQNELKKEEDYYQVLERNFLFSLRNSKEQLNLANMQQLLEKKYQFKATSAYVYVALLRLENQDSSNSNEPALNDEQKQVLQSNVQNLGILFFPEKQTFLFLGKCESSQLMNLNLQHQMKLILQGINEKLKGDSLIITSGLSEPREISKLKMLYQQAAAALASSYYFQAGICMFYKANLFGQMMDSLPEQQLNRITEAIAEGILKQEQQEIAQNLEQLSKLVISGNYPPEKIKEYLKKLYFYLVHQARLPASRSFETKSLFQSFYFSRSISELGTYIAESIFNSGKTINKGSYSLLVSQVCKYMDEHYGDALTVESVAGIFGRTPNYISAKFKKEVGDSFTNYLIAVRISKAVSLLRYTNMPVREVAEKTGFGSYGYFSRTFKRVTGKSAGYYRSSKSQTDDSV